MNKPRSNQRKKPLKRKLTTNDSRSNNRAIQQTTRQKKSEYGIKTGRSKQKINRTVVANRSSSVKRTKKRPSSKRQKQRSHFRYNRLKEWGITLLIVGLLLFGVQHVTMMSVTVEDYSMLPTLNVNERLLVNKLTKPKRFTFICYREPKTKKVMVQRVIGLPGEQIKYQEDQLWVNQSEQVERFLLTQKEQAKVRGSLVTPDFSLQEVIGKEQLGADEYFVLGDNRHYAKDSRKIGVIKKKDILGVVEYRIFPFHLLKRF